MPKTKEPTQKDHRQKIDVGAGMFQVSPVAYWYKAGHFKNEDEAQGAFKLAHQQGLDGMGVSIASWMGLTAEEYDAWYRDNTLPGTKPTASTTRAAKLTFKTWLKQFKNEDSPYGDLAADIADDPEFPALKNSLEPGLLHLMHKGACHQAEETLKSAWEQFCIEKNS